MQVYREVRRYGRKEGLREGGGREGERGRQGRGREGGICWFLLQVSDDSQSGNSQCQTKYHAILMVNFKPTACRLHHYGVVTIPKPQLTANSRHFVGLWEIHWVDGSSPITKMFAAKGHKVGHHQRQH